tara:strand:- start:85 stop:336 length:252 start_codon:yes stop_codon:yes gene_type:complete
MDIAKPTNNEESTSQKLFCVFIYRAMGNKLIVISERKIMSFGLKKLCANILGCSEKIKVAIIALYFEKNISLENKKNVMILIK